MVFFAVRRSIFIPLLYSMLILSRTEKSFYLKQRNREGKEIWNLLRLLKESINVYLITWLVIYFYNHLLTSKKSFQHQYQCKYLLSIPMPIYWAHVTSGRYIASIFLIPDMTWSKLKLTLSIPLNKWSWCMTS